MNVLGNGLMHPDQRRLGEAGPDTLFGLLVGNRRSNRERYGPLFLDFKFLKRPITQDEVWDAASAAAFDAEFQAAPPGYLPYGAYFQSVARAVAQDVLPARRLADHNLPLTVDEEERIRLLRAAANFAHRQFLSGQIEGYIGINPSRGLEPILVSHWQVDQGADICEAGGLSHRGSPHRLVVRDRKPTNSTQNSRGSNGRPEKVSKAVDTYFRIIPGGHDTSNSSESGTWDHWAERVVEAGGPSVKGATLAGGARKDPRWRENSGSDKPRGRSDKGT